MTSSVTKTKAHHTGLGSVTYLLLSQTKSSPWRRRSEVALRGGSVGLNSFEPFRKWISRSVMPRPGLQNSLSKEDHRGLTPLIYSHINPYGRFEVDLNKRIDFDRAVA